MTNEAGKIVPATLFGTSGIRGRLDEFLTPEFAKKVGLSFAAFLENNGTVLVARDVRPQSELIQKAVMSGLSDGGINVLDCGVAPTPATLVALKKLRHKGAVMVTGSHVPAPATGLQGMARAWRELFHQPTRQNQIPNPQSSCRVHQSGASLRQVRSHGHQNQSWKPTDQKRTLHNIITEWKNTPTDVLRRASLSELVRKILSEWSRQSVGPTHVGHTKNRVGLTLTRIDALVKTLQLQVLTLHLGGEPPATFTAAALSGRARNQDKSIMLSIPFIR